MRKFLLFSFLFFSLQIFAQPIAQTLDEETPFASFIDSLNIYPNPFNDTAVIDFSIANDDTVTLLVFDINGALVSTLLQDSFMLSSFHVIQFDGSHLSNGIYFFKLMLSGSRSISKKALKNGTVSIPTIDKIALNAFVLPNPATSFISIQSETNFSEQTNFRLFDVTGRIVLQKQLTEKLTQLDVSAVSKGMYLYTVSSATLKISSGKLVIN